MSPTTSTVKDRPWSLALYGYLMRGLSFAAGYTPVCSTSGRQAHDPCDPNREATRDNVRRLVLCPARPHSNTPSRRTANGFCSILLQSKTRGRPLSSSINGSQEIPGLSS